MNAALLFEGGGFSVTPTLLRTPRKTYRLDRIEYVSVERTFFVFAVLPSAALLGIALRFWRYLLPGEAAFLMGLPLLVLVAAWQIGTLQVHSLALRGEDDTRSIGWIPRLRGVRAAVEQAMASRTGREDRQ